MKITPKLRISVGKPTTVEDGLAGYQRYRLDFDDVDYKKDKYALGWISPRYPDVETIDYLENIQGWWTGWNREVWQEDAYQVQRFRVKLYRVGLKDELGLLHEAEYESEGIDYSLLA